MELFVYRQNLKHLHKTLVLATDEPRRSQVLALIAEEEHKGLLDAVRPRYDFATLVS